MSVDKNRIIQYLTQAGVNQNVINYMNKKNTGLVQAKTIIEITIKELPGLDKDAVDKEVVEQLIKGNDSFCITPDGNIWLKRVTIQQEQYKKAGVKKIAGQTLVTPTFGRDNTIASTTDYIYVASNGDEISEKRVSINQHKIRGEQHYSGEVYETFYNQEIRTTHNRNAQWGKTEEPTIPDEELMAYSKKYSNFMGESLVQSVDNSMQNFASWNLMMERPVSMAEKNFQQNIATEATERKTTIGKIMDYFARMINREREESSKRSHE